MVTPAANFIKHRNLMGSNSSFKTHTNFSNMKLTTVLLFSLLSSVAYTQCVQCGGSRVDIKFTNATITDTNGIDSTLSGEFIYLLDFKNSTCRYIQDGVLQWERTMQYYGIMRANKYFVALWNGEKNPSLGMKAESITVDIKNNSVCFKHDIAREKPYYMLSDEALIKVYKD
jgi:hypothetical protein